jgi:hypothetical protein
MNPSAEEAVAMHREPLLRFSPHGQPFFAIQLVHTFVIYLPAHGTVFFLFSPQQNMQSPVSEALVLV